MTTTPADRATPPVEVVHYNPRLPVLTGRIGKRIPWRRRLNNFGDLLGPAVVEAIRRERGLSEHAAQPDRRLVAVGSIMKLSRPGDVVWGTGVNGKSRDAGAGAALDVRAVRGPLTREALLAAGAQVPEVYGDPGLLVGHAFPLENLRDARRRRAVVVVPNYHDLRTTTHAHGEVVDPRRPLHEVLTAIANADLVVGSSLHGVIVAEAYGVPARLVRSGHEPDLKYTDYYRGTGRAGFTAAPTVEAAIAAGGEVPPVWDPAPLLAAFPADLWLAGP